MKQHSAISVQSPRFQKTQANKVTFIKQENEDVNSFINSEKIDEDSGQDKYVVYKGVKIPAKAFHLSQKTKDSLI